ncbi:MAG: 4Fe-4S binding protein [Deltaproteobacteria bacterium]|jgi:dissimilatory sulfite reductase (desulfoviridin) alpha/beta subunit|nr:4Fe-4S binding protein [Deltaproteobacteria bacterium]
MAADYKALKNGGFMRQRQKDNFSLRLKVIGGNLTSGQLNTISRAAETYGHGYVHLTSRQGVEIPFIQLKDVEDVKKALSDGGVETGVCGPRVRTVTACQGIDICPSGCIDTLDLANEISGRYFGRNLPHKFKFGVTGCQNNCLKAEENDVGIKGGYVVSWQSADCSLCGVCVKACRQGAITADEEKVYFDPEKCSNCGRCVKACPTDAWSGIPGYIVSFGGTFGNLIAQGLQLTPILTDREKVLKACDAALDYFAEHARAGERFRLAADRVGWEALKSLLESRL